jgi:hypothetical protein
MPLFLNVIQAPRGPAMGYPKFLKALMSRKLQMNAGFPTYPSKESLKCTRICDTLNFKQVIVTFCAQYQRNENASLIVIYKKCIFTGQKYTSLKLFFYCLPVNGDNNITLS